MLINRFQRQTGITLLEVLVGFVIFTLSLVAVLDYVGNQIYLTHQSDNKNLKAMLVNELFNSGLQEQEQARIMSSYPQMDISVSTEKIDEFKFRRKSSSLYRSLYSIDDAGNHFEWAVLEVR